LYILFAKMKHTTYHPHDLFQYAVHEYDMNMLSVTRYLFSYINAAESMIEDVQFEAAGLLLLQ
jgi:hypothetical protein